MSILTNNLNPKNTTLDIVIVREYLNYIAKFELPTSIAQHINFCSILINIYKDNPKTLSDIKPNL